MHLSELYGLDIYSEDARFVGKVSDIIVNLETGRIVRLTTEPLRSVSKERARDVLRDKSVLYNKVAAVGDIIILGQNRYRGEETSEVEEESQAGQPTMYQKRRSLLGRVR
jgi:sporulation protein YlmC with PRC-barrel domain